MWVWHNTVKTDPLRLFLRREGDFLKNEKQKKLVINLQKKAEINFYNATRLKERIVPLLLREGKKERGRVQYYSPESSLKDFTSQRAVFFMDEIVEPFIKIMEGLLNAS